jgi:hypothetical protein
MKYLKTKNISKFSISDDSFVATSSGRYVMDGTGAVRIPKGTALQRPDVAAGVHNEPYGYLRYNTDTNSIEAYIYNTETLVGEWETIKASSSRSIVKQTLGPGDATETDFGPLTFPVADSGLTTTGELATVYDYPIVVLVENVIQISDDNYTMDFDYNGSGETWIIFASAVDLGKNITIYYGLGN